MDKVEGSQVKQGLEAWETPLVISATVAKNTATKSYPSGAYEHHGPITQSIGTS